MLAPSWLSYGAGRIGCTGEGERLLDDLMQYLNLEECQRSCDNTPQCNSISWNSKSNNCHLKNKQDVCDDVSCHWGYSGFDWNFYWKDCGNYICSLFCICIFVHIRKLPSQFD